MANKISYKGKVKIVDDEYLTKEKQKDINYLYQFLEGNDYYNFPALLDEDEKNYKYKFIKTIDQTDIKTVLENMATLHSKTVNTKYVGKNKYEEIKTVLEQNTNHIKTYYENIINTIEEEKYMSPSSYLLARNINKIMYFIKTCEESLVKWFDLVKNTNEQRVVLVHNNLRKEHVIKSEEDYIISFDNYIIDTPILDIYKFYQNENYDIDILNKLNYYEEKFPLEESEKLLLNIIVFLPKKISLNKSNYENTKEVLSFIEKFYLMEKYLTKTKEKKE